MIMKNEKELNGVKYILKSNKLTAGQVSNLIEEVIKIYTNGEFLEGYAYNPVDMEINFYAGLFYYTIKDYDMDNNDRFEELFGAGVHTELLEIVTNAKLAYELMWKSAKEVGNSIGIIFSKVRKFLDNLPEQEDLNKLVEKLPEWEKVKDEYNEIIGKKEPNDELKGDKE